MLRAGDVGDGNLVQFGRVAILGDGDVVGERRAAQRRQVQVDDAMLDRTAGARDPGGGIELDRVALAVAKRQGVGVKAARDGFGERHGGVHASGNEANGAGWLRGGRHAKRPWPECTDQGLSPIPQLSATVRSLGFRP